jgi:signal transduction histidine kinase/streptogramin lyase
MLHQRFLCRLSLIALLCGAALLIVFPPHSTLFNVSALGLALPTAASQTRALEADSSSSRRRPILTDNALMNNVLTDNAAATEEPSATLQDFTVEHFGIEQGFANEGVEAIYQDRHGYLWALTDRAFYRYNGRSFTRYEHDPQDSFSLTAAPYHCIAEDHSGNLWIGGAFGLHLYNADNDRFLRMPPLVAASVTSAHGTAASPNVVKAILPVRGKDSLWLGVGEYVVLFDCVSRTTKRQYFLPRYRKGIDERHVCALFYDAEGRLWAARRDDEALWALDSAAQEFTTPFTLRAPITGSVASNGDSAWIATNDRVTLCDMRAREIIAEYSVDLPSSAERRAAQLRARNLLRRPGQTSPETSVEARSVCRDSEGRIWCATRQGLAVIFPATGTTQILRHNPLDSRSLSLNHITDVYQDRSGVIWIGDAIFGLHKYAPYRHKFQLYRHNPFDAGTISDNFIRGILEDSRGNIWAATQFGGLNMLDRSTGKWTRYRAEPSNPRSLSSDDVRALHEDADGSLWVGVRYGELCTLNLRRKEKGFTRMPFCTPPFFAQIFYQDKQKRLWIGTSANEPALFIVSANRKTVTAVHQTHSMPPYCKDIHAFCEDDNGQMWIGSSYGLFRYDEARKSFREYYYQPKDSASIPSNFITSITRTRDGKMWLTTKGGGICRYDRETDSFTRWTTRDGLPHNNVYAALEDEKGTLWISSDNGICAFSPQSGGVRRFTTADGLQGREFNRFSYFQSPKGEMFFGGVEGLNSFFPSKTAVNTPPPVVAIESVHALGGDPIEERITLRNRSEIALQPEYAGMDIVLSALEFTAPERSLFSWTLEGFDKGWSAPTTNFHAIYANLSPGEYLFRAKAASSDGVWSAQEATLRVTVLPAWWQTWQMRLFAVALFVGVMFGSVRWRMRAVEARAKELAALVELRTTELQKSNESLNEKNIQLAALNIEMREIMGIVSHDLRNPISAIMGLVDILRQSSPQDKQFSPEMQTQIFDQIYKAASRAMDLLKNLLEANALESGQISLALTPVQMESVAEITVQEYADKAAEKSIAISLECQESALALADETMMCQIAQNLLSNAVKYSPFHKSIWVRTGVRAGANGERRAFLEIQDEGPGFSDEDKKKLFGRFARLSARPTGGEDSTGLGLSIVKKMVELMNGSIVCESELGKGAKFIVEMPVYDE